MTTDSLNQKFLKEEAARLAKENSEMREALRAQRQSIRALSALYYVSQNITPDVDVLLLLGEILDAALAVLKASDGSLMLTDEETGDLVFTVVRGTATERLVGYRLPRGLGIAGWVAQHRQPQIVRDVHRDPRFYAQVDEAFGFSTRSLAAVPVYLDDGRILGVIEVLNKQAGQEFTQEDLNLILIVAQLAATAMRRAERAIEAAEREKRRIALLNSSPGR
ncbi:MAG: GAF domain-containing protein [Anaerolineales bacterium]|nr:GAF domain-containing protein [Anaerolineales bacterium]